MQSWIEFDNGGKERMRLMIDMAYLDMGIVPPSHYPEDLDKSLNAALSTLTEDERRRACRKYRKLVRKVWNKSWKNPSFRKKQAAVRFYVRKGILDTQDNDE
jgi:hypothetical protein